jgi:formylglycine-generating enzyme required for sulfatase activity
MLPTGAGKYGHLDLGGNLAEMTMDLAAPAPVITPCSDCVQFLSGDPKTAGLGSWGGNKGRNAEFVVFGGAWDGAANDLRTTSTTKTGYADVSPSIGFRCARD